MAGEIAKMTKRLYEEESLRDVLLRRVKELEAQVEELHKQYSDMDIDRVLLTLARVLALACGSDSRGMKTFAEGFTLLADHDLFTISSQKGKRVRGDFAWDKLREIMARVGGRW